MYKYFTIIPIRNKDHSALDTIKHIAGLYGFYVDELLNDMGYEDKFDLFVQQPSDTVIARKLNDILKTIESDIRIGGSDNGIPSKRSIF